LGEFPFGDYPLKFFFSLAMFTMSPAILFVVEPSMISILLLIVKINQLEPSMGGAAALLLQRTKKISYPVDQFKRFFGQKEIRLGGVYPEIITGNHGGSTIRNKESVLRKKLFLLLLDLKNNLICSLR
jgi:hypothetical protein